VVEADGLVFLQQRSWQTCVAQLACSGWVERFGWRYPWKPQ